MSGNNSEPVINFSTPPNWLYNPTSYAYPDNPVDVTWSYESGPAATVPSALGDYYGRVVSWYVNGRLVDEYNQSHTSGHALNITRWEVRCVCV